MESKQYQPFNVNIGYTTNFRLVFTRLPHITYFCQTLPLPGVSVTPVLTDTPFSQVWRAGDKMIYDPLVISFLVDEEFKAWREMFRWMEGLTFPHRFEEYKNIKRRELYSDATLIIYSSKNNALLRYKYFNCFPTNLSQVNFTSSDEGGVTMLADASFQYDTFDIESAQSPVNNPVSA